MLSRRSFLSSRSSSWQFGASAQGAPPAITEQEAHAIAVDAYVYFYPLLSMDLSRKQFTIVEPGK